MCKLFLIIILLFCFNIYSWQGYYGPREYMMEESLFEMLATPCSLLNTNNEKAIQGYQLAVSNFLKINAGRAKVNTKDLHKEFGMLMKYCASNPNQLVITYLMKRVGLSSDWSDFGSLLGGNVAGNGLGSGSSNYYDRNQNMINDKDETSNNPNGFDNSQAYNNNSNQRGDSNYYEQNQGWGGSSNSNNNNQNNNRGGGGSIRKFNTDE